MNTLESTIIESPSGAEEEEECALFRIDTTESPFAFLNICTLGEQYTLTIWARADSTCKLIAANHTFNVTAAWEKLTTTFTAESADMMFRFENTGNYYIYHAKLERGNMSTDWSPAPEDATDGIASVDNQLQIIKESVAQLSITAEGITETIGKTETAVDTLTGEVQTTKQEVLEIKKTSDQYAMDFKKIYDDGVSKVETTTGYLFDEDGLTISKSTSDISTKITEDGMKINEFGESLLTADHNGVEAKDLHARTYLIVGRRSRFENYGSGRTGCFWISED